MAEKGNLTKTEMALAIIGGILLSPFFIIKSFLHSIGVSLGLIKPAEEIQVDPVTNEQNVAIAQAQLAAIQAEVLAEEQSQGQTEPSPAQSETVSL